MIGGAMLLCAVSAMALIAVWSLRRDDVPDEKVRDGILALRSFKQNKKYTVKNKGEEEPAPKAQKTGARKLKKLRFDPDEMAEIEEEAEAGLPQFVRNAREEY